MKRGVQRELPKVGTVLIGKYKGQEYKAKVVEVKTMPNGKGIRFKNKNYKSMTGAAKAITNQSVNGRRFWKF